MSITESFFFLFCDCFFASLILTPRSELVVKLMTIFPGYNLYLVFFIAFLGSLFGSLANWQIGKFCLFLRNTDFFKNKAQEIAKAEEKWHKFLVYILLFSWIRVVGNPFTVLAGFFKTDIKKFLLLVGIGKLIYYAALVFIGIDLTEW